MTSHRGSAPAALSSDQRILEARDITGTIGYEEDGRIYGELGHDDYCATVYGLRNDKRWGTPAVSRRSGPFWDGIEGRAPMPRAAATLGLEFIHADIEKGTIELAFAATEDFTNPTGNVLGAFVAAMLYDTVGPALLATLEPHQFQSTLQINVNFLRPVRPGRVVGKGRVVHRVGDMALLEASLLDPHGTIVATATAIARVIALDQARASV